MRERMPLDCFRKVLQLMTSLLRYSGQQQRIYVGDLSWLLGISWHEQCGAVTILIMTCWKSELSSISGATDGVLIPLQTQRNALGRLLLWTCTHTCCQNPLQLSTKNLRFADRASIFSGLSLGLLR